MRLPEISFRQFMSIKDILITRAYYSSAFRTLSNEIVSDAPSNISNSVSQDLDYKLHFGLFDSDKFDSMIHHFDNFIPVTTYYYYYYYYYYYFIIIISQYILIILY
jgi:hypothetical protein